MNAKTLNQFAVYAWRTLVHPGATFEKLLAEPGAIAYGGTAILFVGTLYTIVSFVGYLNGFGITKSSFNTCNNVLILRIVISNGQNTTYRLSASLFCQKLEN